MVNFLVVGNGFLGGYLVIELKKQGFETISTYCSNATQDAIYLDITKKDSVQSCLEKTKPEIIINCAAIGKIDFLESHPQLAFSINSEGPKNLAFYAQKNGIRMIQISTDSVFDGIRGMYSETDKPNPLNVYAKSKVLGEKNVMENMDNSVIIRTNFYGLDYRGNWFLNWIIHSLKNNNQIIGFTDMFWNPIEISYLCKLIKEISLKDFRGTIHLSSHEIITKYQFIAKISEIFGFDSNLIKKGTYEKDAQIVAKRPKNTTLANTKVSSLLKMQIPSLEESIIKIKKMWESNI